MLGQLFRMLVETHDRPVWIVRFVVQRKDVLHVVDELGVLFGRNHPLFGLVRL